MSTLHRVGQTAKCEVTYFHDRNHAAIDTHGFSQRFNVIEHNDRAIIETEIFDWIFDLAVFNVKSSITGKPGVEQGLRVQLPDIPKPGYQNTASGILDHIFQ